MALVGATVQSAPGNVNYCAISLACALLSVPRRAVLIGFASKMHYVLTALTKYWSYADSKAKSVAWGAKEDGLISQVDS